MLPLPQKKVVQKGTGGEQPVAGTAAGADPTGVFLSWNLAVTRQPGAKRPARLACGVMLWFPQL